VNTNGLAHDGPTRSLPLGYKLMSYLKIFPRSIVANKAVDVNEYVGQMVFDLEMYGCMHRAYDTQVHITCDASLADLSWSIQPSTLENMPVGFAEFMRALNVYLFRVLKFDPVSNWYKPFASQYEYHFEPVYFDLGSAQFVSKKKWLR
jgi:hypothetical protein